MILSKAVNTFRSQLDTSFSQFPPRFLIKQPKCPFIELSHASKMKFIDVAWRCAKRVNSPVDLTAMMAQVSFEIKRSIEKAGNRV